jgi:hypothetical protein
MLQIETNCERKKNMYRSYDLFEEHPEGKMWKGFAADRETALEKLKELYCLAGHQMPLVPPRSHRNSAKRSILAPRSRRSCTYRMSRPGLHRL